MTKIKNTNEYPIKQHPIADDFFIGSDSEKDGTTVNFSIQSVANMLSGLIDYRYSTSSLPLTSPTGDGFFLTNSVVNFGLVTKISVSKKTLGGQNLTPFINFLKVNLTEFTLYVVSKTDRNSFGYYSITSITEFPTYFVYDVTLAPGDNFLGALVNQDIYTFNYEKTASGSASDLLTQDITDGDITHAPSSDAVYDALVEMTAKIIFDADIPVVLSAGKTLGKYVSGQTIPAVGKTAQQVITDIALEYVNPVFTTFSISGQPTTIEVGTTLSGSKPFVWAITQNSATVPTIDLFDNTAAVTLLAGTPNDGSQAQNIATIQLNADGSTQSWRGIGNNTAPIGTFNSGNFIVTARFIRWWSPVASYPANPLDGAANRTYASGLSNSAFKTPGANTFTLVTGTIQNKFIVLLPAGVTIVSVIDQTNANTNITANFILSAITINDIGGTPRNYNMYQYTNAIPYTTSANLFVTTT
ncbi:MAG TPA: hypothetical protein VIV55_10100 [Flavobacterium sp.]